LLEEAGANMCDINNSGRTVWDLLIVHLLERTADDNDDVEVEANPVALISLLRVLVLRGSPPHALVVLLLPKPARVVQEGARLRVRLPAYIMRRQALVGDNCSVLLPPLPALVHGYMELTTTEELWATGLGAAL
jgi:hypothetical protein